MANMVEVLEQSFSSGGVDSHIVERKVSGLWSSSKELRDEFGELENALMYYKALAAGRVKILGRNVRGDQ